MKHNRRTLDRYKNAEKAFPNIFQAIRDRIEGIIEWNRKDQDWDVVFETEYLDLIKELKELSNLIKIAS